MTTEVIIISSLIIAYLLTGVATIAVCPLNDVFKNPLHKIWMMLLWPITLLIVTAMVIYQTCVDFIYEVKEYYRENKSTKRDEH